MYEHNKWLWQRWIGIPCELSNRLCCHSWTLEGHGKPALSFRTGHIF